MSGKSPPCADAIIAAGIARVVSGDRGSQPRGGRAGPRPGFAPPASPSISGWRAAEAAHDHAGHFRRGPRPASDVILKLAVSSDDKIGARPQARGDFGEAARARVHLLRAQCATRSWSASAPCRPTIRC